MLTLGSTSHLAQSQDYQETDAACNILRLTWQTLVVKSSLFLDVPALMWSLVSFPARQKARMSSQVLLRNSRLHILQGEERGGGGGGGGGLTQSLDTGQHACWPQTCAEEGDLRDAMLAKE